jgi:hypothetical protein
VTSIHPPTETIWWRQPLDRVEGTWIALALVWSLIMFVMMPLLELEKGQTYRLHIASMDWQHGFSVQPVNINTQIVPGYEMVLTITPDTDGDQTIICNEYCGIGHHTMLGKIYITEGGL